jgi:molecular chaperone DnaK (HSP70)
MGDQTPILLGGSPHSAAALTGRLLAWVLERVAEAEGGPADHLVLTCPANWGGYKRDVLREAIDIADGEAATGTWPPGAVRVVSEPLATATHYAASARVGPAEVVAVYDLGGGTFDAAIMAGSEGGHRLLGEAIGLEHLPPSPPCAGRASRPRWRCRPARTWPCPSCSPRTAPRSA